MTNLAALSCLTENLTCLGITAEVDGSGLKYKHPARVRV